MFAIYHFLSFHPSFLARTFATDKTNSHDKTPHNPLRTLDTFLLLSRTDGQRQRQRTFHHRQQQSLQRRHRHHPPNLMPYHILEMVEKDETLSTCQMFNAEVCYGSGLNYNSVNCVESVKEAIEDFLLANSLPSYFLGVCQDFKHFGWCVSVIILDNEGKRIVSLHRKEVCYCRFTVADDKGRIEYVLYANWKKSISSMKDVEKIPLLSFDSPWPDLMQRMQKKNAPRKFAVVSRVPTPDSTYYPIPYYAALFKGKWYNIKQLIGMAKEAKLKNSAPLKYHIEVSSRYWEGIFKRERITDPRKQQDRIVKEKQQIIDFLTGAENSGKALFSTFYMSPNGEEQHDVRISRIDDEKEGGDWSTDIQEAVNMFCFTMRVHSNLVGSVPGKAQTNNSGSDAFDTLYIGAEKFPQTETSFVSVSGVS